MSPSTSRRSTRPTHASTSRSLIARFRRHGNFGLVALVGVQSNQYPRALDIARPFRDAGIPVAMGGFHVSGCLAMLDGQAVELDACRELGIVDVRGRGRGPARAVLAGRGRRPAGAALQFHERPARRWRARRCRSCRSSYVARTLGHEHQLRRRPRLSRTSARSAPSSTCRAASRASARPTTSSSWCASTGRTGINKFFITDDNFARNKEWEAIFDRLIELRETDGIPLGLMIQVDTLCHKIPDFIEKAKRAGVTRVFIGLENINPDNLAAAKKRQNKITEYRKMLLAWKGAGHHHARRLHPRLPGRHAGDDPARHRDHPAANCRSTCSSSSA